MKTNRQIVDLQRQRTVVLDRMTALNEQARAGERALTADEQRRWEADEAEVHSIERQLGLLHATEQQEARMARPIDSPLSFQQQLAMPQHSGGKPAFKGQAFTRFVGALALSKGNLPMAHEIAATRWGDDMPEIANVLRTATKLGSTSDPSFWLQRAPVAIGTTVDPAWAKPLVVYQQMIAEFIELLRPETILGRMTGVRRVPFNVKIPRQTAGATANWVGEGSSKPISRLSFDDVTMPWAKVAVIVVITTELARFSTPSAEQLVRDDLIAAVAQFLDQQLIDPTVAPIAGLKPGSITNGAPTIPSGGSSVSAITGDLSAALLALSTALAGQLRSPCWVMSLQAAMYLATLRTAQDIFAFPQMLNAAQGANTNGLSLMGVPVVVSANVAVTGGKSSIILLEQSQIMIADDGETTIDASSEASLQADSAPATPPTNLISLWQQNLLGIKAERYIYWMLRRVGAVQVITGFPGP